MADGEVGMIEIVRLVAGHADPGHHRSGSDVSDRRHGDDLGQPERLEAVLERGPGGLGRMATPPRGRDEPPPDLRYGEPGQPSDSGEAEERRVVASFDRPQA